MYFKSEVELAALGVFNKLKGTNGKPSIYKMDKGTEKLKEFMSKRCFIVSSVVKKWSCRGNYLKRELNLFSFCPVRCVNAGVE